MAGKTLILSFDMETDIGSWTSETRGIVDGTPRILEILEGRDVPATFLFTGREAINNPAVVREIHAAGHEVGCHTMYHESLGMPVYDVPVGSFALDVEIRGRLELATDALEKVIGTRPRSFRAPRLFGSTGMVTALEELGYMVDSSFPAYFYGRDFRPYHPSKEDWSKSGEMRILEVPVFYDVDAQEGGEKMRGRDQWPMLRLKGARWFQSLCNRMFRGAENASGDSVLCVYLHPWEFVEMPRKIRTDESTIAFRSFLWRRTGGQALKALDEFIGLSTADGCRFQTLMGYAGGH